MKLQQRKTIITASACILLLAIGAYAGYKQIQQQNISSFDECVAAGFPIQESSPEQCMVPGGKSFTKTVNQGNTVGLDGKVVCLLPKNPDGPHTLECAIGLLAEDGRYYALHLSPSDNSISAAAGSDKRVHIEGVLKSTPDTKYQTDGTVTITGFRFL